MLETYFDTTISVPCNILALLFYTTLSFEEIWVNIYASQSDHNQIKPITYLYVAFGSSGSEQRKSVTCRSAIKTPADLYAMTCTRRL